MSLAMSLTGSPEYLLRPRENVPMMLMPSVEDSNNDVFDDFFDRELYELNNQNTPDDQSGDLFNGELAIPAYSPSVTTSKLGARSPTQPWRKGLWCLTDKPEGLVVNKTRENSRPQQVFVSPTHLSNQQSLQRSTSPSDERRTIIETKNHHSPTSQGMPANRTYLVPASAIREQTLSPSPMYAQQPIAGNVAYQERWQEDFQNFHLHRADDQPRTKQLIGRPMQRINANAQQLNSVRISQNGAVHRQPQSPTRYHYPFQQVNNHAGEPAPISKPIYIDPAIAHVGPDHLVAMPEPYQYVHVQQSDAPVWVTESLHSSDSSNYSYDSYHQAQSQASQQVWTPSDSGQTHTNIITGPQEAYDSLAAPIPQRATHYVLQREQDPYIQYPAAHEIGCAVTYEPQHTIYQAHAPRSPTTPSHGTIITTLTNALSSYPSLPPPQIPYHTFPDTSPFTPRRQRRSPSRSPSPPTSPTHNPSSPRKPTSSHRRSPCRPDQPHTRRKSITKPGPIITTTTTTTSSIPIPSSTSSSHPTSSSTTTRTRSRSRSRPPRTPRTSRTPSTPFPTASTGALDFVNFTPKDSVKLMADVAPSGSSKTRARREMEAKEKRKRLGELAVQEVARAGGDVAALRKAGVFV